MAPADIGEAGRPYPEAGIGDANQIADILAEAFSEDPMMNWIFGASRSFATIFRELASGLYLKHGFGHVIDGKAATLWLPACQKVKLPTTNELRIAIAAVRGGGIGAIRRVLSIGPALDEAHPSEPHYYLFAVGVRRSSQGKGLGGAIIREGMRRADKDGVGVYLENSNPRNTPLYQSLGFVAQDHLALPSGAPPLLAMLRAPTG